MSSVVLKNILAVDSSTKACSVALNIAGKVYTRHEILPQKHAHRILPMVDEVIKEAGITPQQIDVLAFGEGPGAFTGIRIAAGVIQGLALGWDKPVLPISSLSAISEECCSALLANKLVENSLEKTPLYFCSMLDARMNEVYVQCAEFDLLTQSFKFEKTKLLSPKDALSYLNEYIDTQKITQFYGCGDIETEYPELLSPFTNWSPVLPNAVSLTKLAQQVTSEAKSKAKRQAKTLKEEIPVPIYLRNQIAETIEERNKKKLAK